MATVFSKQQLASLKLELGKGETNLKYSYITEEGAECRAKLEKSRAKRGDAYVDGRLLRQMIDIYLEELGNPKELVLFDFGSGVGESVKDTISYLHNSNIKVHYHIFDISPKIIDLCKDVYKNQYPHISFDYTVIDFEISNLVHTLSQVREKYHNIPVLGLLLGNTVGNFSSIERLLSNIMEAFRIQDRLVIGIERVDSENRKRIDDMIKEYKSFLVFKVLFSSLKELGFNKKSGKNFVIFNQGKNTVESYFEFKEPFSIEIDGDNFSFEVGDKIKIMQSLKVNESSFTKILLDLDLRIANLKTNPENSYLQVLVSPKKYL